MDYKRVIKLLPFILGLFIIPIFIRFVPVDIPYEVQLHWTGSSVDMDIFGYARSILLIVTGVITIVILFFTITSETLVKIKKLKPFVIALGLLVLISIISTIFGGNGAISYGGAPSRYEGLYSYIGYFLLFFYAMIMDYDEKTERVIIIIMACFTVLCGIVGLSQFIGKNILLTDFGKMLYIPKKYGNLGLDERNPVFQTMYILTTHYNYASMLVSILSMFWIMYSICTKKVINKVIAVVMAVLSMLMLLGTNARSGIMAIVVSFIVIGIAFFSKILSNKKISLMVLIVFIVFVGFAFKFGLMSRVTSLIDDIKSINSSRKQTDENIRTQIPLKDINTTEDTYTIVFNDLSLKFDNKQNSFYDKNGNILSFDTLEKGNITFRDERYTNWTVEASKRKSNIDETKHLYHLVRIENYPFNFDVTDKVMFVNHLGFPMYPEKAERIGFTGMEKLGSGRMFIISSTLPLIKKSPLIGYGPDAFLQIFNQDDVYTKMYVYGNPMEIVDKPHSLYLLYAVNFGIVGLGAFIFIIVLLIIKTKKKYKLDVLSENSLYIASFAGVMAYIGSGFFNDSTLAVSPIFWVLLGISIAGLISKEENNKINKSGRK